MHIYTHPFRGTHDDNDTKTGVEVQAYPTMDNKPAGLDAVDSFFYEYRLVHSVSDEVSFLTV
jgi:hypothetical protein